MFSCLPWVRLGGPASRRKGENARTSQERVSPEVLTSWSGSGASIQVKWRQGPKGALAICGARAPAVGKNQLMCLDYSFVLARARRCRPMPRRQDRRTARLPVLLHRLRLRQPHVLLRVGGWPLSGGQMLEICRWAGHEGMQARDFAARKQRSNELGMRSTTHSPSHLPPTPAVPAALMGQRCCGAAQSL